MDRLPPAGIVKLFIRNRASQGWPREKILAALRTRLKWEQQKPEVMDEEQRERYYAMAKLLRELETDHPGETS